MKVLGFLASPLLAAVSLFTKPKASATPVALGPVTRNTVREAADRNDELRRRRGGAADIVTGAYGAEPAPASIGKTTLGS